MASGQYFAARCKLEAVEKRISLYLINLLIKSVEFSTVLHFGPSEVHAPAVST